MRQVGVIIPAAVLAMTMTATVPGAETPAPAALPSPTAEVPPAGNEDPVLLLNRAVRLYGDRQFDQAEKTLTLLLSVEPTHTLARFLRALCYGQQALPLQPPGEQPTEPDVRKRLEELYRAMAVDLDRVLDEGLANREAVVLLVDAVVAVKRAGLAGERGGEFDLLEHARQALEGYLRRMEEPGQLEISALNRVRGRFFLAVVLYRQAVPVRVEGQEQRIDAARLEEAWQVMSSLVESGSRYNIDTLLSEASEEERIVAPMWKSFVELYLGLIGVFRANRERDYERARALLSEADAHLGRARELNTIPVENEEPLIREPTVERLAAELSRNIREELARAPARGAALPVEDLRIDLQFGQVYDSNVILLGDNTGTPRDIGRSADFRFETGIGLNYTLDLARYEPGLRGWTVAFSGRTSASWNFDIGSYNEQNYGGSVAVQKDILEAQMWGGHQVGPLYATIQYDYDYFLLGNDGFLRNNRLTPRLTLFTFDQRAVTTAGLRYEDRNYLEDLTDLRFDRDGNYFALFVSQSFDWVDMTALYRELNWEPWGLAHDPRPGDPEDTRYLRPYIGGEYGWEATRGDEYDNKYVQLSAGIEVPLPYGLMFDFRGEWEWDNYGGTGGGSLIDFHRRGRESFVQRYHVGLERSFVLVPGVPENRRTIRIDRVVMTLRGDIQWVEEDSNVTDRLGQHVFSYDRAIYGVSLILSFN